MFFLFIWSGRYMQETCLADNGLLIAASSTASQGIHLHQAGRGGCKAGRDLSCCQASLYCLPRQSMTMPPMPNTPHLLLRLSAANQQGLAILRRMHEEREGSEIGDAMGGGDEGSESFSLVVTVEEWMERADVSPSWFIADAGCWCEEIEEIEEMTHELDEEEEVRAIPETPSPAKLPLSSLGAYTREADSYEGSKKQGEGGVKFGITGYDSSGNEDMTDADAEKLLSSLSRNNRLEEQELMLKQQQSVHDRGEHNDDSSGDEDMSKAEPAEVDLQLKKQIEFYFSDSSLSRDKFLLQHTKKTPEGWVPLKIILGFKKLRVMGATVSSVLLVRINVKIKKKISVLQLIHQSCRWRNWSPPSKHPNSSLSITTKRTFAEPRRFQIWM